MRTNYSIIRFLFISCLFLASFFSTYAQNVGGGITVGLNASQIDGDQFKGFNKAGLHIGGFVYYSFSDKVKLQPEIVFEQLGSSSKQMLWAKMNYVSVPILLNFSLPILVGESEQQIEIHIGPVLGVLLNARNDFGIDFTSQLDNPDLRAVAGIAYRMGNVSLAVRYGYSIVSFTSNNSNAAAGILGNGAGLFHNYASFSLRWHLFD